MGECHRVRSECLRWKKGAAGVCFCLKSNLPWLWLMSLRVERSTALPGLFVPRADGNGGEPCARLRDGVLTEEPWPQHTTTNSLALSTHTHTHTYAGVCFSKVYRYSCYDQCNCHVTSMILRFWHFLMLNLNVASQIEIKAQMLIRCALDT